MEPMISAIIPTYNRGHCLKDAIDSVFAQSFQDFELIVVDKNSNDETPQVLALYGNRVRVLQQSDSGVSAGRNLGVRHAKGDWIAFLDSDDVWEPDKLKIQVEDLRKNPEVVAHMVDVAVTYASDECPSYFDANGIREEFSRSPLRQRPLLDVVRPSFFSSCWLVQRRVIEQAGYFNPSLRIFEDLDLLARIALEGPFMVNCHVGATIRRRPGGAAPLSDLIYTEKLELYESWAATLGRLKSDSRLTTQERRMVCRGLSSEMSKAAALLWKKGRRSDSVAAHLASISDDPGLRSVARLLFTASGTIGFARRFLHRRQGGYSDPRDSST